MVVPRFDDLGFTRTRTIAMPRIIGIRPAMVQ